MKSFVWLAALLTLLLSAQPASALDDAKAKQVMANAVDGYIRPAYRDFHDKAEALTFETGKFCAAPDEEGLTAVKARFADAVSSWGHIEFLREGPVMQQNRLERILFYPDRKSTGLKQVQALLANPDDSVTVATKLKDRSVAIQGLGAFEFLFYGTEPAAIVAEENRFRCRYGLAIAGNVEIISGELQSAWDAPDGIARDWKAPGADNPIFRDSKEAVSALIGIAVHGVEMVRDQRVKHFYKGRDSKVSPKLAVYWRSDLTMPALAANVDGLAKFWKATDFALIMDPDMGSLADSAHFDLRASATALGKMGQPTAERLKDNSYLGRLDFIEFNLKDAMTRIDKDVGGAVGLGAGFSFADGD